MVQITTDGGIAGCTNQKDLLDSLYYITKLPRESDLQDFSIGLIGQADILLAEQREQQKTEMQLYNDLVEASIEKDGAVAASLGHLIAFVAAISTASMLF